MIIERKFAAPLFGALLLASSSAIAQDRTSPANWAGIYAGIEAGYGFGNAEWPDDPVATGLDYNLDGFAGGIHGGYNFQYGNVVFGPSVSVLLSGISGDGETRATSLGATIRQDRSTEIKWLGLVNGKLGYDVSGWLPYVTGGLAIGRVRSEGGAFNETTGLPFGTTEQATETHVGFNIGAGLETKVTTNLALGAEYKYVDLGKSLHDFPAQVDRDKSVSTSLFSLKLTYVFN